MQICYINEEGQIGNLTGYEVENIRTAPSLGQVHDVFEFPSGW